MGSEDTGMSKHQRLMEERCDSRICGGGKKEADEYIDTAERWLGRADWRLPGGNLVKRGDMSCMCCCCEDVYNREQVPTRCVCFGVARNTREVHGELVVV